MIWIKKKIITYYFCSIYGGKIQQKEWKMMNFITSYFQQLERISWEIFSDMELKYINKKSG